MFQHVVTAGASSARAVPIPHRRLVNRLRAAWQSFATRAATVPPASDRVREAAELRAWALHLRNEDPRFVADLMAAADRHELTAS